MGNLLEEESANQLTWRDACQRWHLLALALPQAEI